MKYQILIHGIKTTRFAPTMNKAFEIIADLEERDSDNDEYELECYGILNTKTNQITY